MKTAYEYKVVAQNGYASYHCANVTELREMLRALTFRQPTFVGTVYRRLKEENLYGTAWCICHEDMHIKLPTWHVGEYADSVYVVGNGTAVVGFNRAIEAVACMGLFTKEEAKQYVLAIN